MIVRTVNPRTKRRPGQNVSVPDIVDTESTRQVAPFGHDRALLLDEGCDYATYQVADRVHLRAAVRDGRVQCIGVFSEPGGPELTMELLRIPVERRMRELLGTLTVHLETRDGEEIGVVWSGGTPREERGAALRRAHAKEEPQPRAGARGRGRPRLYSDEHWREVLAEAQEARLDRRRPDIAIAARWGVSASTARGWMSKATKRLNMTDREESPDE